MGTSWHNVLVYWSVSWPIQVYAVLHARNWHSKNHRYTPIYPKSICSPKNNHRRLFTAGHWRHNWKYEEPPEDTSFLVDAKKMQSIRLPTSCIEAHLNHAYKFYPCHHCYHRLRMKIFNLNIYPAYQYQLQGCNQFCILQGWNYFIQHPHHIQDYSLPHHPAWIQIQILGLNIYKMFEVTSYSQSQENIGVTPESSTHIMSIPAQLKKKICTQASQHLVANHLLNLPHAFHVYNKQEGKWYDWYLIIVKG